MSELVADVGALARERMCIVVEDDPPRPDRCDHCGERAALRTLQCRDAVAGYPAEIAECPDRNVEVGRELPRVESLQGDEAELISNLPGDLSRVRLEAASQDRPP